MRRRNEIIHLCIVLLINFLVIAKLIHFTWNGNDKAILVVIFYYFILIILNMLIWLILDYNKKSAGRIYKITTTILVILVLPVIFLSFIH